MFGIGETHVGKIRENNEDSVLIKNEPVGALPNLYVVADGMGGHKAGEIASSLAIRYCCDYLSEENVQGELLDELIDGVRYANEMVYEYSRSNDDCSNMGTTFVGCTISDSRAYIAHVGDSRLYRITNDDIEQITMDHSYVAEMVRAGKLTAEEAKNHPDRNIITRAVGTDPKVEVDGIVLDIGDNDILLLCSDGLCTMVGDEEIHDIVCDCNLSLDDRLKALVDKANENGGRDNISVILISWEGNE